jgi:hypothetical protein
VSTHADPDAKRVSDPLRRRKIQQRFSRGKRGEIGHGLVVEYFNGAVRLDEDDLNRSKRFVSSAFG